MKEDVSQLFKTSCGNVKWFEKNYDALKKEYDKKWIMIDDKKIIACDSKFDSIMEIMRKSDSKTALVEYMQSEQIAMFF